MIDLLNGESQKKLEDCIAEIEKNTSAEIVVAIARKSGQYRDVYYLSGIICALLSLAVIIFLPFVVIHSYMIIPDVVLFFLVGYFLARHYHGIIALLTSARRRNDQVRRAAHLAFMEEGVAATRNRTGILFYISLFERLVEIIPDLGIDGKIPRAEWNHIRHDLCEELNKKESLEKFLEHLCRGSQILREALPASGENPDEIPNRPRVREEGQGF